MSFNILEAVKKHITPDVIAKASSFLGERESDVTKAISGILPTVLGMMVSKSSSGGTQANEILNTTKEFHNSGVLNSGLGNFFNDGGGLLNKGLTLLKGLFGEKTNNIIDTISNFAGIKKSSAASLLSFSGSVVSGTVGKHAVENNMDAGNMASLLNGQKLSVLNMIPSGLSGVIDSLGFAKIGNDNRENTQKRVYTNVEDNVRSTSNGIKWLLPLLLFLLAAALAWWFLLGGKNGCNKPAATSDTTIAIQPVEDTAGTTTITTLPQPESVMVKLPDGTELNAFKGGIEDKLVGFLNTEWMNLGEDSLKKLWFDFDNLNFKTGSAEITPESQVQINNIVAILKAFPNAKLKVGGYTDKTGNEATNKKISGERAAAVKAAIEKAGQGSQIISAEGYGSEFAQYPADAPEADRVKDRHVSVSVRG